MRHSNKMMCLCGCQHKPLVLPAHKIPNGTQPRITCVHMHTRLLNCDYSKHISLLFFFILLLLLVIPTSATGTWSRPTTLVLSKLREAESVIFPFHPRSARYLQPYLHHFCDKLLFFRRNVS